MNYLSGFLMVKDEDPFLHEWIAFHRTQGYTKFYIYDNGSKIPVKKILKREIRQGLVDVTTWEDKKKGRHVRAMNHCLNRKDIKTVWLSLTDIDEFMYGEKEPVIKFLKKNERYNSLKFTWLGFSANGHKETPKGLVMESYTKRGDFGDLPGGKSIVKFGKIRAMKDPHNPRSILQGPQLREHIFINHYITRSLNDWKEKCRKGGGNGRPRKMETFKHIQKKLSKHKCERILKYVEETKKLLKK